MKPQKFLWTKNSVHILLTEYQKMKAEFDKHSYGSGRKKLWEDLRLRMAERGVLNTNPRNIMKKFFALKKSYKDYLDGIPSRNQLYGFENILRDLLENDPYFNVRRTHQSLEALRREVDSRDLPIWAIHLSKSLKKVEECKRESLWNLQQELAGARKKKVDALEALIKVLKNDSDKVEELPQWVQSNLLKPIRIINEEGIIEKPLSTPPTRHSPPDFQLSPLKDESLKEYVIASIYDESSVRAGVSSNESEGVSAFPSIDTNCLQLISVHNHLVKEYIPEPKT